MSLWSFKRPVMKRAAFLLFFLPLAIVSPTRPLLAQSRADKLFAKMTLEEKIAQLMIVRVSSTGTAAESAVMLDDIARYQPGGVCFFQGGPVREAALTNQMQALSKVPLLVSIDGEWGPAMRLDSCSAFPRQMTLGALSPDNDTLIYQMGLEVAAQCKALGVNLNFAPCIDINNNAKNPVINSRSFGEDRDKVTHKANLYLQGMMDGGIIGCIKHFPGHGDTETDSHLGLPVIKKSRAELDELELYPYRQFINQGVDMIMVAHLNIPALDSSRNSVSSLSYPIVTELLKNEYGYMGIIITDGLEMQGVRKHNRFEGDVEIKALLAGVDILLLPDKPNLAIESIKNAVDSGIIPIELINERCLRVLRFKEYKGVLDSPPVDLNAVPQMLNTPNAINLNNVLEQNALTLLKNDGAIPLQRNANRQDSTVLLCIGRSEYQKEYQEIVKKQGLAYLYQDKSISEKAATAVCKQLTDKLAPYKNVIVAYGGSNQLAGKKYGTDSRVINFLNQLAKTKSTILLHLGNPYALNYFGSTTDYKALMIAYQATPGTLESALNACFGEFECQGTLPVSINGYPCGAGIVPTAPDTGFSSLPDAATRQLDNLLKQGIQDHVYPGCVVMAVQDGKPVYQKAFGHYTYDDENKVTLNTMYDVASITKTAATTLAVMKLYDEGRIRLHDPIGKYLPYLHGTDKAHLTLAELLTHTSGMPAFIPFYTQIQNDTNYLRSKQVQNFDIKVADNVYLRNDYPDTMRHTIAHCKLGHHQYLYSDLNMVLLKDMVETITRQPMDRYLSEHFYRPMGLTHTCFNPLDNGHHKAEIAPTENDETFRHQVVQGYVHDQTAALFYGNAGDAGLFTTAGELAALYQMLLDGGTYHGTRYLSEATVRLFTSAYPTHGCEVRGLGFHTPKHSGSSSIVPAKAGKKIFGHQGFTGTVVWCDPDNKLIFVFLSNRVYPTCYPNKLSQSKIRLKAHEMIYEE